MSCRHCTIFQSSRIITAVSIAWALALTLILPVVSSNTSNRRLLDGTGYSIYLPVVFNRYPPGESEACHGGDATVVIIVEPALFQGIQAGLSQLEQDICNSGFTVVENVVEFESPPLLRSYLAGLYSETNQQLKGTILIGKFPHIYQFFVWPTDPPVEIEAPSYEYYTDLDGDFTATPDYMSPGGHAYSYNQHTGDTEWEIWVGLLPRDTDTQTTIDGLNRYFSKNHAYRNGQLPLTAAYLGVSHEYKSQTTIEYNKYMGYMHTGYDSWKPFSNADNARIYFDSIDPALSVEQAYVDMSAGLADVVVQYGHGNNENTGSITFEWLDQNPLRVAFLASGGCYTAYPDGEANILTRILYHPNSSVVVSQGATSSPGGRGSQTVDGSYGDNIAGVLATGGRFGEAYLDYINKPTYMALPDNELGNVLHFVLALIGDPTLRLYR